VAQKIYIPNLIQTLGYIYNLLWNLSFSRPVKLNDSHQFRDIHMQIVSLKKLKKCTKDKIWFSVPLTAKSEQCIFNKSNYHKSITVGPKFCITNLRFLKLSTRSSMAYIIIFFTFYQRSSSQEKTIHKIPITIYWYDDMINMTQEHRFWNRLTIKKCKIQQDETVHIRT
jgi:hypothetical protein